MSRLARPQEPTRSPRPGTQAAQPLTRRQAALSPRRRPEEVVRQKMNPVSLSKEVLRIAARVFEAHLAAIPKHVFAHTAPPQQRRVHSPADRSTAPDHSWPGMAGNAFPPPTYQLQVRGTDSTGGRTDAHLALSRFGGGPLQHRKCIRACIHDGSHGLMTTLLRSGMPMTSIASWIWDRGKRWR